MNDLSGTPVSAPVVIHRADYRPPEWLVPEIALDFALSLTDTRVLSTLKVRRNPQGTGAAPLRLNGDAIEARAVTVDGKPCNSWRMDGADLVIDLP
ncbi:MAG: aminopeptidase N, partial [Novosphingobium meiothermophilum]